MIMAPVIPGDLFTEGVAVKAIGIEATETMEPLTREGSELSVGELTASDLIEVTDAVQPLGVVKGAQLLAMHELIVGHKRLMATDNVTRNVPAVGSPAAHMVVVPDAAKIRSAPPPTKTASGDVRTTKMPAAAKVGGAEVTTTKMGAPDVPAKATMASFGDRTCNPEDYCTDRDYRLHRRVS